VARNCRSFECRHRNVKSGVNAILGLEHVWNAAVTISVIKVMHSIRKGQFDLTKMQLNDITPAAVCMTVLSARAMANERRRLARSFYLHPNVRHYKRKAE
jgi:hypothetical protein